MEVQISKRAAAQIARADAWWRAHREKNPLLFDSSLRRALALVGDAPLLVGRAVQGEKINDARVIVLPKTGHLLFYRVVDGRYVRILKLGHGRRQGEPTI